MISCQNVIRHELIGLDVLVAGAANPFQTGVSGHIIDETRNLVVIQTHTGIKKIPKLGSTFRLSLPDNTLVEINGSALILAPEKRLKRA
ncbi:ribonuclease P protein subunit [Methanoregula sp.]|jgi:ribonuclease P protein subunit POP4|uniref:ribonuclease P protein component 1 n=1 Tax=Methanoregula sp. TaxID=2052170 RepID=UPI00260075CE|nr:ribonuclease P protein subunit [Methanoregula sp.]